MTCIAPGCGTTWAVQELDLGVQAHADRCSRSHVSVPPCLGEGRWGQASHAQYLWRHEDHAGYARGFSAPLTPGHSHGLPWKDVQVLRAVSKLWPPLLASREDDWGLNVTYVCLFWCIKSELGIIYSETLLQAMLSGTMARSKCYCLKSDSQQ